MSKDNSRLLISFSTEVKKREKKEKKELMDLAGIVLFFSITILIVSQVPLRVIPS
jgi:hypothetical protein